MIAVHADLKEQVLARITDFSPWFREIKNQKHSGNGGWVSGQCPFHEDAHNSFSYDPSSGGWTCFTGCGSGDFFDYLQAVRGADFKTVLRDLGEQLDVSTSGGRDLFSPTAVAAHASCALENDPARMAWLRDQRGLSDETIRTAQLGWDQTSGRYTIPVRDESGKVVNVRQYGPGRKPKMLNLSGHGSPARLFGVGDLERRGKDPVVVCEGELDCLLLRQYGFLAVTGTAGAAHFHDSWVAHFAGRDVSVIYDCDGAGIDGAQIAAKKLVAGGTAHVRVVRLPLQGTPEDKDVTDYFLRHGASATDLQQLIDSTLPVVPARRLASIGVNDRQMRDIMADAWAAIHAVNCPPLIFRREGRVVTIDDPTERPAIATVSEPHLRALLHDCADWVKIGTNGASNSKVPRELPAEMLARPDRRLPELKDIVTAPVFTESGNLVITPGYDPATGLWLHLAPSMRNIHVDPAPDAGAITRARLLIEDDLFVDFPFANASDLAHAFAALILPFVRRMISGCTPLHLIEAATPASGKSLLADLVGRIATGHDCGATTVTRNEEEMRKKITAMLLHGSPVILIDNVKEELTSAPLASALTSEIWTDRELGHSHMVVPRNHATWLMTGNNPRLNDEIVRRAIRIRIEPVEEHPETRTGFKHPNIRSWTIAQRPALVGAVLTLVNAWIAAGEPRAPKPLGSFEEWSEVIGGILLVAGVPGFLEDRDQYYAVADEYRQQWRALIESWLHEFGYRELPASILFDFAQKNDLVPFARLGATPQSQKVRFAVALGQLRDRRFGDLRVRISQDSHEKTRLYQLCPVQSASNTPEAAP